MEKILSNIKIGEQKKVGEVKLSCRKTHSLFTCSMCHFKGENCPRGKVHPICFASERADKESVYYYNVK